MASMASMAVLPVALLTGCRHVEVAPPPRRTAEQRLRDRVAAEVAELAALYAAVIARFPQETADLSTYAAEHSAHVDALRGPAATRDAGTGTPSASATAGPAATVPEVAATRREARAQLAAAEETAARRRAGQAAQAPPGTARLLASIAACEAGHAALLREVAG